MEPGPGRLDKITENNYKLLLLLPSLSRRQVFGAQAFDPALDHRKRQTGESAKFSVGSGQEDRQ